MNNIKLLLINEEEYENAISFICQRKNKVVKIGNKEKVYELLKEKWFRDKLFRTICNK